MPFHLWMALVPIYRAWGPVTRLLLADPRLTSEVMRVYSSIHGAARLLPPTRSMPLRPVLLWVRAMHLS